MLTSFSFGRHTPKLVSVSPIDSHIYLTAVPPDDFPLYRAYPHVLSTAKLSGLGWQATQVEDALAPTIENHRESERTGRENGLARDAEERVLGVLDTI